MVDLETLEVPTLHQNGSGKAVLMAHLKGPILALDDAIRELRACAPHARDYYIKGDDAFPRAQEQHAARMRKLMDIRDEFSYLYQQFMEQV